MLRLFAILVLATVIGACTWPPRPSVPPAARNPAEPVEEEARNLPRTQVPSVPSVSPPPISLPRAGGGLL